MSNPAADDLASLKNKIRQLITGRGSGVATFFQNARLDPPLLPILMKAISSSELAQKCQQALEQETHWKQDPIVTQVYKIVAELNNNPSIAEIMDKLNGADESLAELLDSPAGMHRPQF